MDFTFGDIVIIEKKLIGVVVKSWGKSLSGKDPVHHEVYVRSYNAIKEYEEHEMRRYMVRHKKASNNDLYYQEQVENA